MTELSAAALDFLEHITARVQAKRATKPAQVQANSTLADKMFRKAAVQHVFDLAALIPAKPNTDGPPAARWRRRAMSRQASERPGSGACAALSGSSISNRSAQARPHRHSWPTPPSER